MKMTPPQDPDQDARANRANQSGDMGQDDGRDDGLDAGEHDGADGADGADDADDAVIGAALRWSLLLIVVVGIVAGGVAALLMRTRPVEVKQSKLAQVKTREAAPVPPPRAVFSDITSAAGIRFHHENGARGRKLLPETMGGGCAFFDFDQDGDQDLLLVNSNIWPWDAAEGAGETARPTAALYRNDGAGNFEDVTAGSGLDVPLYAMGAAVGDYDNDGRVDVFLSAVGENRLFHNRGDGRFQDVTATAGVAGDAAAWGSSCGWFDCDNDGDLDLFVCNYVQWSRESDESQSFKLTGGERAYGRPQNFPGAYSYLYRNEGDGTFVDVSRDAGIQVANPATQAPMGKSLGVSFADFDEDGWIDILVANDTVQNFLFHNRGDGTFDEQGALTGIGFDMDGQARGAMGVDIARFRENDSIGVAIGNFSNEMTALYVANGSFMQFADEAVSSGLGPNTRLELTFGVVFVDYDLDGRLDLLAANGHLEQDIHRVQPSQHYEQPPQLFWNGGRHVDTEFVPVDAEQCGPDLRKPMVGRGASCADIDGDGDIDLLLVGLGSAPRLLRNDQQLGHHWLRIQLVGRQCNRDAIGAWVEVHLKGGRVLRRQVMPTRSYLSQSELPVTFGLAGEREVEQVVIHWPGGATQTLTELDVDRSHVIQQPAP